MDRRLAILTWHLHAETRMGGGKLGCRKPLATCVSLCRHFVSGKQASIVMNKRGVGGVRDERGDGR